MEHPRIFSLKIKMDRMGCWTNTSYLIDSISLPVKKPWQNKSVLNQKYLIEGVSLAQIAKEFLCSKNTIRGGLIRTGIPLRKRQERRRSSNVDYGKRLVKGRRVEHLAEQRVIHGIVEMRNDGLSFQKIAEVLSEIGVPTKKRGQRWHGEVVRNIYLRAHLPEPPKAKVHHALKCYTS